MKYWILLNLSFLIHLVGKTQNEVATKYYRWNISSGISIPFNYKEKYLMLESSEVYPSFVYENLFGSSVELTRKFLLDKKIFTEIGFGFSNYNNVFYMDSILSQYHWPYNTIEEKQIKKHYFFGNYLININYSINNSIFLITGIRNLYYFASTEKKYLWDENKVKSNNMSLFDYGYFEFIFGGSVKVKKNFSLYMGLKCNDEIEIFMS